MTYEALKPSSYCITLNMDIGLVGPIAQLKTRRFAKAYRSGAQPFSAAGH